MRPLTVLDGGNIVKSSEFQFASNTQNFIGFGSNLSLLECFKIIQCPKFHWIWIKPHGTLGNVSDRKTILIYIWKAMKIYKDLVYFMFQISTIGIGNWSL